MYNKENTVSNSVEKVYIAHPGINKFLVISQKLYELQ